METGDCAKANNALVAGQYQIAHSLYQDALNENRHLMTNRSRAVVLASMAMCSNELNYYR
ncbi:unnamed protein product, partial [Rotaria sp. Silwood2]